MATRVVCDHCGNTISGKKPNKFSFGPSRVYDDEDEYEDEQPKTKRGSSQPLSRIVSVTLDLCDNCGPIWMERVRKITEESEPDGN